MRERLIEIVIILFFAVLALVVASIFVDKYVWGAEVKTSVTVLESDVNACIRSCELECVDYYK